MREFKTLTEMLDHLDQRFSKKDGSLKPFSETKKSSFDINVLYPKQEPVKKSDLGEREIDDLFNSLSHILDSIIQLKNSKKNDEELTKQKIQEIMSKGDYSLSELQEVVFSQKNNSSYSKNKVVLVEQLKILKQALNSTIL